MGDKVYWHCKECEEEFVESRFAYCPLCGRELEEGPLPEN